MGDRANYAILHKGKLSVFYAHWGGPTVPREPKDGPAACERFIRGQERERSKAFLEFAYMEGGIALDKDRKRALVFGGPAAINYDERVQARLLQRLRPTWQKDGWTLDWARRYAYDLVTFVGVGGEKIEADFYLGEPAPWDDVVAADDDTSTLLARKAGSAWDLRRSSTSPGRLIQHGTRLLEAWGELPSADAIKSEDLPGVTAFLFDEAAHKLVLVS